MMANNTIELGDNQNPLLLKVNVSTAGIATTVIYKIENPTDVNKIKIITSQKEDEGNIDPAVNVNIPAVQPLKGKYIYCHTLMDFTAITDDNTRKLAIQNSTVSFEFSNSSGMSKTFNVVADDFMVSGAVATAKKIINIK